MQTEVLCVTLHDEARLCGSVRFLQPLWREAGERRWQEALERRVQFQVGELGREEKAVRQIPNRVPAECLSDAGGSNEPGARASVRKLEAIQGTIDITAQRLESGTHKITVRVLNVTHLSAPQFSDPDAVIMRTFTSTHTVLHIEGGEFVSLLDPAPEHKAAANGCVNL